MGTKRSSSGIVFSKYKITLLLLLSSFTCIAQNYKPADSVRIYMLLDKADAEDLSGNIATALKYASEALTLSREKKMQRGEGFALLKIADLKLKQDGAVSVADLFNEPMRIGAALKDSFLLGLSYHQLGQYYKEQTAYNEAETAYSKAVLFYEAKHEDNYIAVVYNDRGFIADRKGIFDKAVQMFLLAIKYFEKTGNTKEAANTLGNLAVTYYKTGNREEAINMFKVSAQMRETIGDLKGLAAVYGNLVTAYNSVSKPDSALKYQKLAVYYAEKTGVKNTIAQAYANASALAIRQDRLDEAMQYEQKSILLYKEMGDKTKLASRYISVAVIYEKLSDSAKAEKYFQEAEAIATELNNKPLFQSVYSARSSFYLNNNNFKQAFRDYKLFSAYKDSLLNEKSTASIAEMKTKYETEKKDNEISRLETEQKIKQLELEKQQAIISGNKKEAKEKEAQIQLLKQQQIVRDVELQKRKEELEKQSLLNKSNEQQLLLSVQQLQISENEKKLRVKQLERERLLRNGMIGVVILLLGLALLLFNRYQLRKKIQEQENLLQVRNKISKDLHDEIGSTLTSINILSKVSFAAVESDPGQAKQMLGNISQQSKTIQQNMSDIVWAIRPDNDKLENLVVRMREYIGQTLEPQQIKTHLEVNEASLNQFLPMQHRKELLLIFKEALNNVVKHSGATEVDIKMEVQDKSMFMTVCDNGKWKGQPTSSGTGTYSMKQRAEGLGGQVIISGTEKGTTVQLRLPLP